MTLEEVRKYYGSVNEIARCLGITRQAVQYWKSVGHIPLLVQCKIEVYTNGELKADTADHKKPLKTNK